MPYDAPQFMRDAAAQGLKYFEDGLAGDGLTDQTVDEARDMARGIVTEDKWIRVAAWIARHMGDLDSPAADPDSEDYPSAGVVAHLLWGSGPSKDAAERALVYATDIVAKIESDEEEEEMTEDTRKASKTFETRVSCADFEIRETPDGMTFEGYAAVFNSRSENLGGFTEFVSPGAFTRSLKSRNDVKLLWNHDSGQVLGSTRARTLTLTEDARGLKVTAQLPNTQLGRDTAELLKRGDVDAMSFGFNVIKDKWNAQGDERTLEAVRLFEVSIVAFPAYSATAGTATVRSLEKLATRAEVDAIALDAALTKLEAGEDLDSAARDLLTSVIDKLSPSAEFQPEPESSVVGDLGLLALKKKKIEFLSNL